MHGRKKSEYRNRGEAEKEASKAKVLKYKQLSSLALTKRQEDTTKDPQHALQLSGQLLRVNPDVYSLWNHRKEIIVATKEIIEPGEQVPGTSSSHFEPLEKEFALIAECIQKNPKSYGAWHHRKWLVEKVKAFVKGTSNEGLFLNILDRELGLCARFLDADERNFHCWNYRRFVAQVHPNRTATDEFNFSTERIYKNFSNYSAFHHRTTYIQGRLAEESSSLPSSSLSSSSSEEGKKAKAEAEGKLIKSELEMVQQAFFTEPDDQTAWWYHQYLITWAVRFSKQQQQQDVGSSAIGDSSFLEEVLKGEIEAIRGLLEDEGDDGSSYRWAVLTLASLLQCQSHLLSTKDDKDEARNIMEESKDLYQRLIEMDPDHAQRYISLIIQQQQQQQQQK